MKTKYANNMKMKPKISGCRENSPRGVAQVRDYDTVLIYKLIVEITFFLLTRMLLKTSEKFL